MIIFCLCAVIFYLWLRQLKMDLSKFKETTRPANNKAGWLHREWTRLKYWVLPPTNDKRTERLQQYRDFGLFLAAIGLIAFT